MNNPLHKTIPIMMTLGGIAGLGYYGTTTLQTNESIREVRCKTNEYLRFQKESNMEIERHERISNEFKLQHLPRFIRWLW